MVRTLRLLLIGLLGGMVGAEMWQRRKLRPVARKLEYEGRLMHAAIVVTHGVRGEIDTPRILNTAVKEIARTLRVDHCLVEVTDSDRGARVGVCSCGSSEHSEDNATAEALKVARASLAVTERDRYVVFGRKLGRKRDSSQAIAPAMGVPIVSYKAHPRGVLLVASSDCTRVWLESEMQLLLAIAHQLSLAVAHAHVFATTQQHSLTDPLTGCINRRGLDIQLEEHLRRATEASAPVSVIMIDLDHFKHINDTYGHERGDEVLVSLGNILLDEARGGAFVARLGGEEFVFVLPGQSLEQASLIAEKVRQRIASVAFDAFGNRVTVSCGVACFPCHASTQRGLLKIADSAMYRAKELGRNRVYTA
jgi:diguanylate cyclase (GGDEF)-like protein